ncbi:MAG: HAD family phosphatase [Ruminococcus sp.]|nr:HAD family phosphatase [Candidatus Copronaster equi]
MGIFSGCLLASDYDGTLANSRGEIDKEVRDAIKYFTANGGLFTVCTGRTKQGFHAFTSELMNAPVLLGNGTMAYDFNREKTVFNDGIKEESIDILRAIKDGFSGIGIEYYDSLFSSYVIYPDERTTAHFEFQSIKWNVVDDFNYGTFPLVKVMVSVGKDRCMEFQRFLDSIDMGDIKYIPQYGNFIEIISKSTDKGKGLLKLAQALHIDKSKVFAVGDGANDVTMLKAASIGFVAENGDDYAKKAGDIIVKSNDEFAVADAISKIEKQVIK